MMARMVGTRIGERLGWPAERVAAMRDERTALSWLSMQWATNPLKIFSCAGLAFLEQLNSDTLRFGEMGALRLQLERSGKTVAELVGESNAYSQRLADELTKR
jgi:hypothetical protein